MGNDLAVRATPQVNVLTSAQLKYIAHTEFIPVGLRGKENAILACVATGRALGIDDMTALRSIHIIDGKATFSAELMVQLVRRRGHSIVGNFSATSCTVTGKRADNGDEMTVTWTKEMAQEAGLLGKNNWKKYGASMLWARAVSQLARMLFADCFAGATYTEDEIGDAEYEEVAAPAIEAAQDSAGEPQAEVRSALEPGEATVSAATTSTGEQPSPADAPAPSAAQIKKLNVLVGTLREAGKVTTLQVWEACGRDPWLEGHGDDPHWSPLRDSLTKGEASQLIEWLTAVEAGAAPEREDQRLGPDPSRSEAAPSGLSVNQLVGLVSESRVDPLVVSAAIERVAGREGARASELSDVQRGEVWAKVSAGVAA